jgi:hypothetical protein
VKGIRGYYKVYETRGSPNNYPNLYSHHHFRDRDYLTLGAGTFFGKLHPQCGEEGAGAFGEKINWLPLLAHQRPQAEAGES